MFQCYLSTLQGSNAQRRLLYNLIMLSSEPQNNDLIYESIPLKKFPLIHIADFMYHSQKHVWDVFLKLPNDTV